jgi:phosphatidylinositol alpha-1,6-mannosyltransferase
VVPNAPPPLCVLGLVTDAFGEQGGIAQFNRHFLSSLAACTPIREVIVLPRKGVISPDKLPRGLRQLPPMSGKFTYSVAALAAVRVHRPIDVVFCGHLFMAPLAAWVARLCHARLWIQVHGFEAWQELSAPHRRAIQAATVVTSVSRYTRHRLLQWAQIDPTRVRILPNTVDQRFHPGPKPDYLLERHALHGKKVLMTVSRLSAWDRYKGHERVIRILPRLLPRHPEAVYLVVGEGDDRARLEALAIERGLSYQIQFTGAVADEQLPDYFRLADLFVMPSTGEGFGIVFLEALASRCRVIGGNRDGSFDALYGNELAAAIDPDNEEELLGAILTALEQPAGKNRNDRFSIQMFRKHVDQLLNALILPNKDGVSCILPRAESDSR